MGCIYSNTREEYTNPLHVESAKEKGANLEKFKTLQAAMEKLESLHPDLLDNIRTQLISDDQTFKDIY